VIDLVHRGAVIRADDRPAGSGRRWGVRTWGRTSDRTHRRRAAAGLL